MAKNIDILLVDDNEDDVDLTIEALTASKIHVNSLNVVADGVEAMAYLKHEGKYKDAVKPSLIFLDLNMPRKNGREVLQEIKADENLKTIPVVILTTSDDEVDVIQSYNLHANCYVRKPVDLNELIKVVKAIDTFWFTVVELPPRN
ncbi:MAG: response regulator [Candidatus Obscuribacterales bacterium]|nr:response regulator [Candidatus Obscuribacterales bacterium]